VPNPIRSRDPNMSETPTNNPTFIIAEAGVNHNGSLDLALDLVDAAARTGADAVKFQTFRAERLVTTVAKRAPYQAANLGEDGDQLSMLRKLELSERDHYTLIARCQVRGIAFMSTAFDADSLTFVASLNVPVLKIPSGDITAAPLLVQAARTGKPLIVSTGMATLTDIEQALGVIAYAATSTADPDSRAVFERAFASPAGQAVLKSRVTLLHCVTDYPAPPASVNLRAIDTMRAAFGLPVGYSDHTLGTAISIAAVARGATVIEKHITLDRTLPGPDHAASLEPAEMTAMVAAIRDVEAALGDGRKVPQESEHANRIAARRSLVAARAIRQGERITANMLTLKRPGSGLSPLALWDVAGSPAVRDYAIDDPIDQPWGKP
jgi:N-acetylneuraminate synthase